MPKKHWLTITILLLALLVVSACERPASTAPVTTPEVIDTVNTPLPVDQQIMNATMTAQAIMEKFNQPTQVVTNTQGTAVAVTPTKAPTAVPTATPFPPTPMVTKPAKHSVQGGETIYCLARRFDVDPGELLSLNGLYAGSMLSIGDELDIPTTGKWPGDSRVLLEHPDTWTVSAGETVNGIACEYGDVYPEQIIAVNGLKEPYELSAGDILQIP